MMKHTVASGRVVAHTARVGIVLALCAGPACISSGNGTPGHPNGGAPGQGGAGTGGRDGSGGTPSNASGGTSTGGGAGGAAGSLGGDGGSSKGGSPSTGSGGELTAPEAKVAEHRIRQEAAVGAARGALLASAAEAPKDARASLEVVEGTAQVALPAPAMEGLGDSIPVPQLAIVRFCR